jgi:translocation and assembly module TamB
MRARLALALALLLLPVARLAAADDTPAPGWLGRLVSWATGGQVRTGGLSVGIGGTVTADRVDLEDKDGVWLTIENMSVEMRPLRLFAGELHIDRLTIAHATLARTPVSSGGGSGSLPLHVILTNGHIDRFDADKALIGQPVSVSVDASGDLPSLEQAKFDLAADALDDGAAYRVAGALEPASIQLKVDANEPAGGLIARVAGLHEALPLAIAVSAQGPLTATATNVSVTAGALHLTEAGTVNLSNRSGDVQLDASLPAMTPMSDAAFQSASLHAHLTGSLAQPAGSGTFAIAGLAAQGATIARVDAQLNGDAARISAQATLTGVQAPAEFRTLLPSAPITLNAEVALSEPGKFDHLRTTVSVAAGDVRLGASGSADIPGRSGDFNVSATVPAMTPLGAVSWQSAALQAHLSGPLAEPTGSGTLTIAGLAAQGASVERLDAQLNGNPTRIAAQATLTGLHAPGQFQLPPGPLTLNTEVGLKAPGAFNQFTTAFSVMASGLRLEGSGNADVANRSGELNVSASLPAMAPIANVSWQSASLQAHVAGSLAQPAGSGTLSISGLSAEGAAAERVDAAMHADGGRMNLQATLTALRTPGPRAGLLAAAPVVIDASADLGEPDRPVKLTIEHPLLDVTATARTAGAISGDLTGHLKDIAALAPGVRGSLTVDGHLVPDNGLSLTAGINGDLASGSMPAAAVQASLHARGLETTPTAELTATAAQASNRVQVDASLDGRGQARLQLAANAYGARASATAGFDVQAKLLSLTALTADWQGQHAALQTPVRVSLADGVRIDRLRLGLNTATLDVSGRVSPSLDLTAALRNLSVGIADQFVPNLGAQGTVNADARLTGSFAQPAGTIRVTGSGLRMATGTVGAFPPAQVTANAMLAGTTARVNANATAGSARFTVTGTAPLDAAGALDLHAKGNLDLALLNRILAAHGTTVHGEVALDAAIAGTVAAPRAQGTLRLSGGEVQDVVHGMHLQAIAASLQAQGDSVRIERLNARAGDGTISASGSIGLAAPLPVDVTVTAHNARPISSDLVTTVLDADVTLRGSVMNALTVGGNITLDNTEIRVPERLPASVAVLKIVNTKAPPPPPPLFSLANVALDLNLSAPSQVFVRGRGLDSEFYGQFHIGGTAAAPRPDGRLRMRRGTFDLVGKTLTFSQGTIGLDGSGRIDPTLDFTATNMTGNTTSTLQISGYASDPKFTLSSVPPLPQDEVLSQLLFGKSTSSLGVFQLAGIAAGIAQLTGAGGGFDPLDKLRSGLGLSYLNVGQQGSGSGVSAGREIATGVTIGARQSVSGQGAQATMQIDLGRGFKLETALGTGGTTTTTTGDPGGSSVGLSWEYQY